MDKEISQLKHENKKLRDWDYQEWDDDHFEDVL